MLFANAAPNAARKPMATSVVGSGETSSNAALDAMKKFEGPANGIMLSPNEVNRTNISSAMGAITSFPFPV